MRFDYYSATKPASPVPLVEWLSDASRGLQRREFKPRHGYRVGLAFDAPDGSTASVCFGGSQEHALVEGSGPLAAELAQQIRVEWPEHKVTRADVCEDMRGAGLYEQLIERCTAIAQQARVRVRRVDSGDTDEEAGRTWYYGAPSSAVRVRVYEKGRQLLEGMSWSDRAIALAALRDLVRFEAQVRPDGDARWECAQLPPERFLGSAAWLQQMAEDVLQMKVERLAISGGYREPDHERAMRFMVQQYHKHLTAVAKLQGGDWEAVGRDIGRRVAELHATQGGGTDAVRALLASIRQQARSGFDNEP